MNLFEPVIIFEIVFVDATGAEITHLSFIRLLEYVSILLMIQTNIPKKHSNHFLHTFLPFS